MSSGEKGLVYLYCVTGKEPSPAPLPGLPAPPFALRHRQLHAVASEAAEEEFGEEGLKKHLPDLEWVKEKAAIHNQVIEEIMKGGAVIPFQLGTVFKNRANLRTWMKKYRGELEDLLIELDGKEEWGLKLYCEIGGLRSFLAAGDGEIAGIDKAIAAASAGKGFLLKKKRDGLLDRLVEKKLNDYGQEAYDRLRALSARARINKLLPREVTERGDDMILNAAFLVDRAAMNDFIKAANDFKDRSGSAGLFFDFTGPWPPYNFCALAEKKDGA